MSFYQVAKQEHGNGKEDWTQRQALRHPTVYTCCSWPDISESNATNSVSQVGPEQLQSATETHKGFKTVQEDFMISGIKCCV